MNRQKGQALPLGVVLIMFSALMGIVLFNTSQLASEKTRLANTADAAVYSGLVWQARTLNFQAYTNRAMVANQVAIGQMVSLATWTKYGKIAARNINRTVGLIPWLRPFTQAFKSGVDMVDRVVSRIVKIAIPILDTLVATLSGVQKVTYNAVYVATPEIVNAVVKRNDERYKVLSTAYTIGSAVQNARQWRNLAQQYDDYDMLDRKADLIMRSRDRFTRDRSWSLSTPNLPFLRVSLVKEGETRLIHEKKKTTSTSPWSLPINQPKEKWSWKGKDTLSLHVRTWGCSWHGCGWHHEEIPIGWGETYVEDDVEFCENPGGLFGWWFANRCNWGRQNSRAESLADLEKDDIGARYKGVRAYYDLKDLSKNNKDPRVSLSVEVETANDQVRTSSKVNGVGSRVSASNTFANGMGRGAFRADDAMASDSIASMSTAEVYFKRPEKLYVNGREQTEYGSLFNPYWQVRLKKTSKTQRLAAWAIRSVELN